jgi:hypothetical protein
LVAINWNLKTSREILAFLQKYPKRGSNMLNSHRGFYLSALVKVHRKHLIPPGGEHGTERLADS